VIELNLTTKEAVILENDLDLLVMLLSPNISTEIKLKLLDRQLSPETINAHEKLKAELDNLAQAQRMLLQQPEPRTDLTSGELIALARQQGISMHEFLGAPKLAREEAIAAYKADEITEGRLAECLGVDRLEARRIAQEGDK
jgi:hypothetical protein